MKNFSLKSIAGLLFALASIPSIASVSVYTSQSAFNAAIGGLTSTSGFNGISATTSASVPFAGGAFTATTADLQTTDNASSFSGNATASNFPGYYLVSDSGPSVVTIVFSNPVDGFAIDFGQLLNGTNYLAPGSATGTISFAAPGFSGYSLQLSAMTYSNGSTWVNTGVNPTYLGFVSSSPFSSATVESAAAYLAISDITLSNAPVSSSNTSVPEPGQISIFLAGLALLLVGSFRFRAGKA